MSPYRRPEEPSAELTKRLRAAARLEARRAKAHRDARDARDALIREALAAGMTHAAIAEATGVTRGRINQLREATP